MNLNRLKDNPVLLLMLGATIVAATRYVTVFAFTEGFHVAGEVWNWINALSGLGMAVLEGFAVFYCWNAWSKAPASVERNVLLTLIVAMFATLTGAVMPAMTATTLGATLPEVMPGFWVWIWTACVTVAPFLVMAASGLADKLRGPRKTQSERKADETPRETVAQVALTPAQPLPQLSEGRLTLKDAIQQYPNATMTELAEMLGTSRQNVSQKLKRLEAAGEIRRNGHIELTQEGEPR